jgi:hypothetical protein
MLEFNHTIAELDLRKISLSGRRFTCSNGRPVPTLSKLDRVFWSHQWLSSMLIPHLSDLSMSTSDHAPLKLCLKKEGLKRNFQFKKYWLNYEETQVIVQEVWDSTPRLNNIASIFFLKLYKLRLSLTKWAGRKFNNQNNCLQKNKDYVRMLDTAQEYRIMTPKELQLRIRLKENINKLSSI